MGRIISSGGSRIGSRRTWLNWSCQCSGRMGKRAGTGSEEVNG